MSLTLNDELCRALAERGGKPIELTDDQNRRYVLLTAEQYERMARMLENEEIDPSFYEAGQFVPDAK
jgi:hypothetical protein